MEQMEQEFKEACVIPANKAGGGHWKTKTRARSHIKMEIAKIKRSSLGIKN
jgi:hypothetical protein